MSTRRKMAVPMGSCSEGQSMITCAGSMRNYEENRNMVPASHHTQKLMSMTGRKNTQ